tara:strand:- start:348 stop:1514 length:1167 start_codon:yes stop_codon:yes gene_type:complete
MSIPLISNLSFVKVSSSGNLNDKIPATRINLPIQYFQNVDNITGNLELSENASHKKVILDTQDKTVINVSGSPLTNDSSITTIELRGSGNIQSQLKSHTITVSDSTNLATTTSTELNNSLITVDNQHTFETTVVDDVRNQNSGTSFGDGNTNVTKPNTGSASAMLVNETYYQTVYTSLFGGVGLDNINRSDFGMSFTHAFSEDGTNTSGAIVGPSGPSSFDGVSADQPDTNTTHSHAGSTYRFMRWNSALVGVNKGNSGTFAIEMFIDSSTGRAVVAIIGGRGAFNQIKTVKVTGSVDGRRIRFTNNLSIPAFLTGGNPFTDVSVASSATVTATRDNEIGSFQITASISGSNDSGQPFALAEVASGVEDLATRIDTTNYTGTLSARAF